MAPNSEQTFDKNEYLDYTGANQWNAIYTIQLGELVENGIFDWQNSLLNWKSKAYNDEQFNRLCAYFIERFRFREISVEPFYEWATMLYRKIAYELMPKYIPLYQRIDQGVDPFQDSDEYHKRRTVGSDYPETLLSGNADYASNGTDEEYETMKEGNLVDSLVNFAENYKYVDELICDELECMFIGLYTISMNAL